MTQFFSKPLVAEGGFEPATMSHGEPALPSGFDMDGERLDVAEVIETRRSYKNDRGDSYLKRHWFAFRTGDGRVVTVYFDRGARRGMPRWWLYSIDESS